MLSFPLRRPPAPLPVSSGATYLPVEVHKFNVKEESAYEVHQGRRDFAGRILFRGKFLTTKQQWHYEKKEVLALMQSLDWTYVWTIANQMGDCYMQDYLIVDANGRAYRLNEANCRYLSSRFPVIDAQVWSIGNQEGEIDYQLVFKYHNRIPCRDSSGKQRLTSILCDHLYYKQMNLRVDKRVDTLTPKSIRWYVDPSAADNKEAQDTNSALAPDLVAPACPPETEMACPSPQIRCKQEHDETFSPPECSPLHAADKEHSFRTQSPRERKNKGGTRKKVSLATTGVAACETTGVAACETTGKAAADPTTQYWLAMAKAHCNATGETWASLAAALNGPRQGGQEKCNKIFSEMIQRLPAAQQRAVRRAVHQRVLVEAQASDTKKRKG
jgi:hypothetical protein